MYTKILLVKEAGSNCVGNTTDTKLDAVTIVDKTCDNLTDSKILLVRLNVCDLGTRRLVL